MLCACMKTQHSEETKKHLPCETFREHRCVHACMRVYTLNVCANVFAPRAWTIIHLNNEQIAAGTNTDTQTLLSIQATYFQDALCGKFAPFSLKAKAHSLHSNHLQMFHIQHETTIHSDTTCGHFLYSTRRTKNWLATVDTLVFAESEEHLPTAVSMRIKDGRRMVYVHFKRQLKWGTGYLLRSSRLVPACALGHLIISFDYVRSRSVCK